MNRMAEFILRIVSSPNSVLFIDEIENGIHYQTQEKLWDIIFALAVKHNVQTFATTLAALKYELSNHLEVRGGQIA